MKRSSVQSTTNRLPRHQSAHRRTFINVIVVTGNQGDSATLSEIQQERKLTMSCWEKCCKPQWLIHWIPHESQNRDAGLHVCIVQMQSGSQCGNGGPRHWRSELLYTVERFLQDGNKLNCFSVLLFFNNFSFRRLILVNICQWVKRPQRLIFTTYVDKIWLFSLFLYQINTILKVFVITSFFFFSTVEKHSRPSLILFMWTSSSEKCSVRYQWGEITES